VKVALNLMVGDWESVQLAKTCSTIIPKVLRWQNWHNLGVNPKSKPVKQEWLVVHKFCKKTLP